MSPIGIFDSGYGGLTVLKAIAGELPQYDYIYLGDNARAPYGSRSYEVVYQYTLECVNQLFSMGCKLVILACNTASAKALRTIQQVELPKMEPGLRVLGVIRPTAEIIGTLTKTNHIGILATTGTVASESYLAETKKFYPQITVYQEACPMWVPLVENNEFDSPGADFFVKKHLNHLLKKSAAIDVIILGCTHYPLLIEKIRQYTSKKIQIVSQGEIVAESLRQYLLKHPEIESICTKKKRRVFYTTDTPEGFDVHASRFFGQDVMSIHLKIHTI